MTQHFFGCLSKTGYGVDYLRKNQIAEKLYGDLKNPESKLNQKRADLWALGHIGQSEFGMSYLIGCADLVKYILDMANNSDHLLLKGVCLHVANMFAQQNAGREYLKELAWEVNLLKKNDHSDSESEFICLPALIKNFLSIPKKGKTETFQQKSFYWDKYTELMRKITEDIKDNAKAVEFFDLITKIPIRMSGPKPFNLSEIMQTKMDRQIYQNTKLFYSILIMLTFYNFPSPVRKNYYLVMDHFFNVPNFLVLLDEDHDFEELLLI